MNSLLVPATNSLFPAAIIAWNPMMHFSFGMMQACAAAKQALRRTTTKPSMSGSANRRRPRCRRGRAMAFTQNTEVPSGATSHPARTRVSPCSIHLADATTTSSTVLSGNPSIPSGGMTLWPIARNAFAGNRGEGRKPPGAIPRCLSGRGRSVFTSLSTLVAMMCRPAALSALRWAFPRPDTWNALTSAKVFSLAAVDQYRRRRAAASIRCWVCWWNFRVTLGTRSSIVADSRWYDWSAVTFFTELSRTRYHRVFPLSCGPTQMVQRRSRSIRIAGMRSVPAVARGSAHWADDAPAVPPRGAPRRADEDDATALAAVVTLRPTRCAPQGRPTSAELLVAVLSDRPSPEAELVELLLEPDVLDDEDGLTCRPRRPTP